MSRSVMVHGELDPTSIYYFSKYSLTPLNLEQNASFPIDVGRWHG